MPHHPELEDRLSREVVSTSGARIWRIHQDFTLAIHGRGTFDVAVRKLPFRSTFSLADSMYEVRETRRKCLSLHEYPKQSREQSVRRGFLRYGCFSCRAFGHVDHTTLALRCGGLLGTLGDTRYVYVDGSLSGKLHRWEYRIWKGSRFSGSFVNTLSTLLVLFCASAYVYENTNMRY